MKAQAQVAEKVQYDVQPLQKWVLIRKVFRKESVTEGGLILKAGERSQRGEVVAAPPDIPLDPGDMVIFTNFPIELEDLEELTGDKNLKLVRYEEIYAIVRPRPLG